MTVQTDRNWEVLLLTTLLRAREYMPGPGLTEEDIENSDKDSSWKEKAKLSLDINKILDEAYNRGHGWLPR